MLACLSIYQTPPNCLINSFPFLLPSAGSIANISILTLKGQTLERLAADCLTTTVGELKGLVSTRMPGQDVRDMKLVYRAKFLSDERKTLAEVGIRPGPVQQHLVSR